MSNRKSITENNDLLHLEEVGMICPLCKKPLLSSGSTRTNKNFQIAHIYPCNPTTSDLEILSNVTSPKDTEEFNNKIALCKNCHWDYDYNKTVDKYNNLVSLKNQIYSDFENRRNLLTMLLEDDIIDIIHTVASLDDEVVNKGVKISYNAMKIDSKIDSKHIVLRRQIKENVSLYYNIIRREFKELDSKGMRKFDQIALQMRSAYLKTLEKENDKEIIFNHLVNWLKTRTNSENCICQIIISFFIQNCEIYDEITK
ncbi:MAG: ABC-three component system protein [Bacteroidales bacterium]